FGAFVDVGVHQDGLVHVSAMADRFVRDPRELVKPGDLVRVKVLEVDVKRRRIALTMRLEDAPTAAPRPDERAPKRGAKPKPTRERPPSRPSGVLAEAFARAGLTPKR